MKEGDKLVLIKILPEHPTTFVAIGQTYTFMKCSSMSINWIRVKEIGVSLNKEEYILVNNILNRRIYAF